MVTVADYSAWRSAFERPLYAHDGREGLMWNVLGLVGHYV